MNPSRRITTATAAMLVVLAAGAAGCLVETDDETAIEELELNVDEADPQGDPNQISEPDPEPWREGRVVNKNGDPSHDQKTISRPKIGPGTPGGKEAGDGDGSGARD